METVEECIKVLKFQLGHELSCKKLIYLDLNFWINLRKCMTNDEVENEYYEFYNLLLTLVQRKKVICPINHSVFIELLKQGDIESRINTAKVIDLFSNSVTLIFELEREEFELQYYIREKLLNESFLSPIELYIWIKIPYVMGTAILPDDDQDQEIQQRNKIDFLKYSWNVTLEEMIKGYLREKAPPFLDTSSTASNLNEGKFLHSDEIKSLENLFKIELRGALSVVIDDIKEYFIFLSKDHPEVLTSLVDKHSIKNPNDLCKRIESDILNDKIEKYLPNIYINTCLYTFMRWDKNRKFKPNDLYDFQHARAALPYYQYFFTDGSLKHLISMKPYELSKKYGCIVENEIKEINKLLTQMLN